MHQISPWNSRRQVTYLFGDERSTATSCSEPKMILRMRRKIIRFSLKNDVKNVQWNHGKPHKKSSDETVSIG